jgi:hypothetical protein
MVRRPGMSRRTRQFVVVTVVGICLCGISGLSAGDWSFAQGGCQAFRETDKSVCGRFLDYWRENGGLSQQGYPISPEMSEVSEIDGKTYTVQYFERAVFERHPENAAPNDVLLSLLGVIQYRQKYPAGAPGQATNIEAGARRFAETGRTVGGVFLDYWNRNGGLAQQGFPISDEFTEQSDVDGKMYRVQYFERAVFEFHPENAAPYNVLLSLLGALRYRAKYVSPGGGGTQVPAPGTATAAPVVTVTPTAVPPTGTETNTPKPAKTEVTCPELTNLRLTCLSQGYFAGIFWEVSGGGSHIEGELTVEEQDGRTETFHVTTRSGRYPFYPTCGYMGSAQITASIEIHDECGHAVSAECSTTALREPCP